MRITIVGSGIAGLAAAVSLHAAGFDDVTVFEADPGIRPHGLGLNILPNAVREIAELGLLDEVRRRAVPTRELAMYNPYGDLVWREDRGTSAGYAWPQLSVSRSHLVLALAAEVRRRLGEGAVVTDARLVGLDHGSGGACGVFADRRGALRRVESDVLLGADGIRSAVRAALYPDEGPPPTNGVLMYRGTAWGDAFLTGRSMAVLGDDSRRLVLYPIDRDEATGRSLINWVAAFPPDDTDCTDGTDSRSAVLAQFGEWSPPGVDLARLLEDTPDIRKYPMTDRDPLPRWTFGSVTLLGDAAHAMYPAGSNGATQAVVDARVLARHLATRPDAGEALRAYEDERRPQMTELQRSNRSMGPERVITLAHRRAPHGFEDVRDVFSEDELADISRGYAVTGKFDQDWVNTRPSLSVGERRRPAARRDTWSEE
ncbi:flavin-dependent oxidoreductase [Streptomyces lucensis JCM 4490]|uniref:Flavin-dependent oxidoreductase n=1 Tax=Streptomyces lucensis JCM 4490 TaxID=1306176 RepID=A0A918J9K4_9ACTN|nr:FAD-dependent monooxygenase [Streptomyces lucensis]GGW63955.1 flavin-dependent oxidoreductase [Streptomyces lucensis JCM 4490]